MPTQADAQGAAVQDITISFCCLSVACHALGGGALLFCRSPPPFLFEALVACVFALGSSLAAALVRLRFHFWVAEAIHLLALVTTAAVLKGRIPAVEVLALTPFLVELQLYADENRLVPLAAVFATAVFVWADLWPAGGTGLGGRAFGALLVACAAFLVYCAARILVGYRERLVEQEHLVAGYEEAFANIVQANLDLQTFAASAETQSADNERRRITRELHDSVGYSLTNTIMTINAALLLAGSDASTEEGAEEDRERLIAILKDAKANAERYLQDSRRTLHQLRAIPEDSKRYGLRAVSRLARAFGMATGIEVDCHFGNLPQSLGEPVDRAVYRLVQEGLTNAFRHGKATHVRIQSRIQDSVLHVAVTDNGRGSQDAKEGIGLRGMRERLAALDGTIRARNVVGGFELSAEIPLELKGSIHARGN